MKDPCASWMSRKANLVTCREYASIIPTMGKLLDF